MMSIAFLKLKKKSLYKINCLVKWVGLKFKNFKNIEKKCTNINENPQTTWKKKKKKKKTQNNMRVIIFLIKSLQQKKSNSRPKQLTRIFGLDWVFVCQTWFLLGWVVGDYKPDPISLIFVHKCHIAK